MKRTTAVAGVILALPLLLAGCGGGGDSEKQAILDDLRSELVSGGASEEQADCIMGAVDDLSIDDLKVLQDDSATPSQEVQDTVMGAMAECAAGG
jgi:hypothetical protein